jgi:prepilin-type N-terminal cleavage/methylation domain-containing protein
MKYFASHSHTRLKRGFTLVEMIIAIMIFSIVAVVALGAVIKIISANRKAQTLQSAISNMSFTLDATSRDLRVGSNFQCGRVQVGQNPVGKNCTSPSYTQTSVDTNNDIIITFTSPKRDPSNTCNLMYGYRFTTSDPAPNSPLTLEKAQMQSCSDVLGSGVAKYSSIISSDVTLTGFQLSITNTSYPLIFIKLAGYVGTNEREKTTFDIQTAVSARTP